MSKKNYFTLLIMLSSLLAWSQNTTILSGKVTDAKSTAISKASVYLLNTNYSALTGEDGAFSINNIPTGKYTMQVSAAGYATVTRNITLAVDKNELITFQLITSAKQLDEVVVSAQKIEEAVQQVPFSITAISSKQVQEFRLWNSKEISAVVPNLYAADPGDGRNVISIRGVTTTSYDPAVATYVDGVNQFGLDSYISELLDIDRIEVLKGPQGTLYGRNAMGGVINIITKQPTNIIGGFAEVSMGNYNQQRYTGGFRLPLVKNKLFVGVSGVYSSRDGFYKNEFDNSSFDKQYNITGNYYLKYIANSKWTVTLNAKHSNSRNNGAFSLVIPMDADDAYENAFVLNQNATTKMVDNIFNSSLSVNHYGKAFNFSSQTAYQSDHRYYKNPIDGDFNPIDGITIINNFDGWNKVQVGTQEFKFTSPTSSASPLTWTVGAYFFYQDNPVKQAIHFGVDAAYIDPNAFANSSLISTTTAKSYGAAAYGQATYAITKNLDAIAGLRFDYEKKKYSVLGEFQMDPDPNPFITVPDTNATASFNAFSPKAGLAYQLMETSTVFATYSRGYRTGGLTQLGSDPSQPPLYKYKPEYSDNIEIGIKNNLFSNRLRLNVAGFITYITDAQVPTLVLPDAITVTRNAGKLESKGIEAEANIAPVKGLELGYSIGYTQAEYTKLNLAQGGAEVNLEGNKQIFTPDITSMVALQYSYSLGTKQQLKLVVRGEWMYFGKQYFDLANNISQAPYSLLNTRCGIASKNFELMFWGRNLEDTKYVSYAYDFGAVHLGNPQTYGVTLTGKF